MQRNTCRDWRKFNWKYNSSWNSPWLSPLGDLSTLVSFYFQHPGKALGVHNKLSSHNIPISTPFWTYWTGGTCWPTLSFTVSRDLSSQAVKPWQDLHFYLWQGNTWTIFERNTVSPKPNPFTQFPCPSQNWFVSRLFLRRSQNEDESMYFPRSSTEGTNQCSDIAWREIPPNLLCLGNAKTRHRNTRDTQNMPTITLVLVSFIRSPEASTSLSILILFQNLLTINLHQSLSYT